MTRRFVEMPIRRAQLIGDPGTDVDRPLKLPGDLQACDSRLCVPKTLFELMT